jgi:hypothetical protein
VCVASEAGRRLLWAEALKGSQGRNLDGDARVS